MASRSGHIWKFFLVLVCLVSWLEASNHCALASLQRPGSEESCCSKTPAKPKVVVCCQVLQSVQQTSITAPSNSLVLSAVELPTAPEFSLFSTWEEPSQIRIGDPPSSATASQVDLQRCHPAIAPPFFS